MTYDPQAFGRGQQQALNALASYRSRGWDSLEACKAHLYQVEWSELEHAQEQARLTQSEFWYRHVSFYEGYLSVF